MLRWYAVRAKFGEITWAEANLAAQRFDVFSPFKIERVVDRRCVVESRRRLFEPYLFAAFDRDEPEQRWRRINSTRGVERLLPLHLELPTPLPAGCVEAWRRRAEAGEFTTELRLEALAYLRGDPVPVVEGTYAGHVGAFVEQRGRNARLMMKIVGGAPVPVDVPIECIVRRPVALARTSYLRQLVANEPIRY